METFSILMFLCALTLHGIIASCEQTNDTSTTFDVTKYGALGNGEIDDSKVAFLSAWNSTCGKAGKGKLVIPGEKTYLLNPTSFQGPCKCSSLTIEISGEIIAPEDKSVWKDKLYHTWLSFKNVHGLIVLGNGEGRINGRGSVWWKNAQGDAGRPTALQFHNCQNLTVDGLKHVDSQRNHISIIQCNDAIISNLNISAPSESPNTDGVDISASKNVQVHHLNISTGDDCIAINGGCSNIMITKVACGPGHGISVGSLGKDGRHEEVEDIQVQDCSFNQTKNGVRIKTWQGGSGFARNISFSGITLHAANHPIIIDQYYCPHQECDSQASAVEVTNITYSGINGTSMKTEAIIFNCSQSVPCSNILLENISIRNAYGNSSTRGDCVNARGVVARSVTPNLTCPTSKQSLELITKQSHKLGDAVMEHEKLKNEIHSLGLNLI